MSAPNITPLPVPRKRGRPRKDEAPVKPAALPAERIGFNDLKALTGWGAAKIDRFVERGDYLGRRLPTYLDHGQLTNKGMPCRFWLRSEVLAFMAALTERYHASHPASATRSA